MSQDIDYQTRYALSVGADIPGCVYNPVWVNRLGGVNEVWDRDLMPECVILDYNDRGEYHSGAYRLVYPDGRAIDNEWFNVKAHMPYRHAYAQYFQELNRKRRNAKARKANKLARKARRAGR